MADIKPKRPATGQINKIGVVVVVLLLLVLGGAAFYFWPEIRWRMAMNDAQAVFAREDLPAAKEKYETAANLAIKDFGPADARTTETMKKLALVNGMMGKWNNVMEIYKRLYALSSMQWLELKLAHGALRLSGVLQNMNAPKGVSAGLVRAENTIESAFGPVNAESMVILPLLAKAQQDEEKYSDAESNCLKYQDLARAAEGENSVGTARAHQRLGSLYVAWAQHNDFQDNAGPDPSAKTPNKLREQAKEEYKKAIDILKKVNPTDLDAKLSELNNQLATVDQKGQAIPDSSDIPKL